MKGTGKRFCEETAGSHGYWRTFRQNIGSIHLPDRDGLECMATRTVRSICSGGSPGFYHVPRGACWLLNQPRCDSLAIGRNMRNERQRRICKRSAIVCGSLSEEQAGQTLREERPAFNRKAATRGQPPQKKIGAANDSFSTSVSGRIRTD